MFENIALVVLILIAFWMAKGFYDDHQLMKRFTLYSDEYLENHPTAKTWDEINCIHCLSTREFKIEIAECAEGHSCSDCGKDLYMKPSENAYKWTYFQKKENYNNQSVNIEINMGMSNG